MKKLNITWKQLFYMFIADIGYALALNLFYVDNRIAAGGLAGIATVIKSFWDVPVGLTVLALSVPIVLLAIKVKGLTYTVVALLTTAMYSVIVDVLSFLPCLTDDLIVAVICGGALYGVAAALTVKAHMSSGGTDLLAKVLITKFKDLSIGTLLMIIDGSIVVMSMIAFKNIEIGIYAILAIATCSIVLDAFNRGFNRAQLFFVFASKELDLIADEIMFEMDRGVTSLFGEGKYTNNGREILMVAVSPHETPQLKEIIHKHDPNAFIVLVPANEIIGEGFDSTRLTETIKDQQEEKQNEIHKSER